jgi:acyl-CoA synthetase (AMP-forming)/AMP-acid ligase II
LLAAGVAESITWSEAHRRALVVAEELSHSTERLVVVAELDERDRSDADYTLRPRAVKREITSAISDLHALRVADLVLVAPGSIPITTSGKIRRSNLC